MPRHKPTSTRQKKADIQYKRAVKRGDALPPDSNANKKLKRRQDRAGSTSVPRRTTVARQLESSFPVLPATFLEDTKLLAAKLPLQRPIPSELTVFDTSNHFDSSPLPNLTCPRRPKWRFDMSKKEVEHNEEGIFKKWLEQTDSLVTAWQNSAWRTEAVQEKQAGEKSTLASSSMPASPTYFEKNLETWRQLWRVIEISQILLVLLDSRCPLLHFPPSLSASLVNKQVILVLTKVDISGLERVAAWTEYFVTHYPHLRVVQAESYVHMQEGTTHQGKSRFKPHLPQTFRGKLVNAIRSVHAEMIVPSSRGKGNSEEPSREQRSSAKRDIDWERVLSAGESQSSGPYEETVTASETSDTNAISHDPGVLTIGLIGQPNVGKSSLLNAIFGAKRVRASKTPGKTKHFQTLYLTPEVCLVDCPGLVMPNYVPLELQVLCGILPISRIPAIPSCIHFASQRLPIERIYSLEHPSLSLPPAADKRTWRDGVRLNTSEFKQPPWTAIDILTSYAQKKKWVTAKAGRPDIYRAGNAILRALAEGRIGWGFWPPDFNTNVVSSSIQESGAGLWIPCTSVSTWDLSDERSDDEPSEMGSSSSPKSNSEVEESDVDEIPEIPQQTKRNSSHHIPGRFQALTIDDSDVDSEGAAEET